LSDPHTATWLSRAAPYFALIIAAAFWGGTWTAGKGAYQDVSPAALAFLRWAVAVAFLLPLVGASLWRHRALLRQEWKTLVLLTFIGAVVFNYMIFRSLHTTSAINGALMNASTPVYVVLLSFVGIGERSTRGQIAGIAIAAVGLVVIVVRGSWERLIGLELVEGDLWVASAMFLWALYNIGIRGWRNPLPPVTTLTAMAVVAVIMLAPWAVAEVAWLGGKVEITEAALYGVLYLGVFASVGSYVFWNYGIRHVGAASGSLFQYLIPVFAAVFAVLILAEEVALYHLAGTALIAAGILIANRRTAPVAA